MLHLLAWGAQTIHACLLFYQYSNAPHPEHGKCQSASVLHPYVHDVDQLSPHRCKLLLPVNSLVGNFLLEENPTRVCELVEFASCDCSWIGNEQVNPHPIESIYFAAAPTVVSEVPSRDPRAIHPFGLQ